MDGFAAGFEESRLRLKGSKSDFARYLDWVAGMPGFEDDDEQPD